MEPGDFVEPEIAVTAAVTAAILSPRARKVMRKGLVYGMAGILVASDTVTSFAKSVGQGVQHASASMATNQEKENAASKTSHGAAEREAAEEIK